MSEKHMEDLRRICLICGCHTSQIINVFEPRNGPNIVELIRAKFKFQPVSDDKYLCYTCNNWLINWHSLRNINKDSADDQPENSRCRMNNSTPEESDHMSLSSTSQIEGLHSHHHLQHSKKRNGSYFPKRPSLTSIRIGKIKEKYQSCSQCGRTLRKLRSHNMQKPIRNKLCCKYCPKASKDLKKSNSMIWRRSWGPSSLRKSILLADRFSNSPRSPSPVVDSKLVAKLQRLGTTLVWESDTENGKVSTALDTRTNSKPVKFDTQGGRVNERNEVLIDFNQVLSEVFPLGLASEDSKVANNLQGVRDSNDSTSKISPKSHDLLLEEFSSKLPEGITISLVSSERHIN